MTIPIMPFSSVPELGLTTAASDASVSSLPFSEVLGSALGAAMSPPVTSRLAALIALLMGENALTLASGETSATGRGTRATSPQASPGKDAPPDLESLSSTELSMLAQALGAGDSGDAPVGGTERHTPDPTFPLSHHGITIPELKSALRDRLSPQQLKGLRGILQVKYPNLLTRLRNAQHILPVDERVDGESREVPGSITLPSPMTLQPVPSVGPDGVTIQPTPGPVSLSLLPVPMASSESPRILPVSSSAEPSPGIPRALAPIARAFHAMFPNVSPLDVRRELEALVPDLRMRLENLIDRMRNEYGYSVEVVETVRSQTRQDALFAQGRTAPGPVVTWTRTSPHQEGRAADVKIDGGYADAPAFQRLARVARELGLRTLWPRDPGHIELPARVELSAGRVPEQNAGRAGIDHAVPRELPVTPLTTLGASDAGQAAPNVRPGPFPDLATEPPVARSPAGATPWRDVEDPVRTVAGAPSAPGAAVAPMPAVERPASRAPMPMVERPASMAPMPMVERPAALLTVATAATVAAVAQVATAAVVAQVATVSATARVAEVTLRARAHAGVTSDETPAPRTLARTNPRGDAARHNVEGLPALLAPESPDLASPVPLVPTTVVDRVIAAVNAHLERGRHNDGHAVDERGAERDLVAAVRERVEATGLHSRSSDSSAFSRVDAAVGKEGMPVANMAERIAHALDVRDTLAERPLSSVLLRLDHPEGGEDRIRVELRGHSVSTTLEVRDPIAADRLSMHAPELSRALAQHGLDPEQVTIRAGRFDASLSGAAGNISERDGIRTSQSSNTSGEPSHRERDSRDPSRGYNQPNGEDKQRHRRDSRGSR